MPLEAERIAITGLGTICALARDARSMFSALCQGKRGTGPLSLFEPHGLGGSLAAEVKGLDEEPGQSRTDSLALIAAPLPFPTRSKISYPNSPQSVQATASYCIPNQSTSAHLKADNAERRSVSRGRGSSNTSFVCRYWRYPVVGDFPVFAHFCVKHLGWDSP